jgi:hypothetical protein
VPDPDRTTAPKWGRIAAMNASLVPLHLGSLHPVEQLLVYALAFGPFLVLGVVVLVRRHRDRRGDSDQPDQDRRDR